MSSSIDRSIQQGFDILFEKLANSDARSQTKATMLAEATKNKVKRGELSCLQLEIKDIPLPEVKFQLIVARHYVDALYCDSIWEKPQFQLRLAIARNARIYLTDYLINSYAKFKARKAQLKLDVKEVTRFLALKTRLTDIDVSFRAEISVLKHLVGKLSSEPAWWDALTTKAGAVAQRFASDHSKGIKNIDGHLALFGPFLSKQGILELGLIIDSIRLMDSELAKAALLEILASAKGRSWQTIALILDAVKNYRFEYDYNCDELLNKNLSSTTLELAKLDNPRVNLSLLVLNTELWTATDKDLHSLLVDKEDAATLYLRSLPAYYFNPKINSRNINNVLISDDNIVGREQDIEAVWEILQQQKYVTISAEDGMGKSSLARLIAKKACFNYEIVWFCNSNTPLILKESLDDLVYKLLESTEQVEKPVQNAANTLEKLFKLVKDVLLIFDDASNSDIFTINEFKEMGVSVLVTTTSSDFPHLYPLKGLPTSVTVKYIQDSGEDQERIAALVQLFGGSPLALRLIRALHVNYNTKLIRLEKSLGVDPTISRLVRMLIRRAIKNSSENLKEIFIGFSLLSPYPVLNEVANNLTRSLDLTEAFKTQLIENFQGNMYHYMHPLLREAAFDYSKSLESIEMLCNSAALMKDSSGRDLRNLVNLVISNNLETQICKLFGKIVYEDRPNSLQFFGNADHLLLLYRWAITNEMEIDSRFHKFITKRLQQEGHYRRASKFYKKFAYSYLKQDPQELWEHFEILHDNALGRDNSAQAHEYLNEGLNVLTELGSEEHTFYILDKLGDFYRSSSQPDLSEDYYSKAESLLLKFPEFFKDKQDTVASFYLKYGRFLMEKQRLDDAENALLKALNLVKSRSPYDAMRSKVLEVHSLIYSEAYKKDL